MTENEIIQRKGSEIDDKQALIDELTMPTPEEAEVLKKILEDSK